MERKSTAKDKLVPRVNELLLEFENLLRADKSINASGLLSNKISVSKHRAQNNRIPEGSLV